MGTAGSSRGPHSPTADPGRHQLPSKDTASFGEPHGNTRTLLLTNKFVRRDDGAMHDVEVIEDPAAAAVALDPMRARLLAELVEPGSAAALAARVGITRQKVNYHLQRARSARPASSWPRSASAAASPSGCCRPRPRPTSSRPPRSREVAVDPDAGRRPSLGSLPRRARRSRRARGRRASRCRAEAAGKRLPTMAIDTEIRFRSAEDRAAFADELTAAVLELAARYHHDDGRPHRLVVAAHPKPEEQLP